MTDDAEIGRFAARILTTQDVRFGSIAMNTTNPPPPLQVRGVPPLHVAAVLHGLADHTHNLHMLNVAEGRLMARPGDTSFDPAATSLGRYFHALAQHIEDTIRETETR